MGAEEFATSADGATAEQAFHNAREAAFYDVGHQGYSGTIAEKDSFTVIPCDFKDVDAMVDKCLADEEHFCQNKWGPAAAIEYDTGRWVFFGWASS